MRMQAPNYTVFISTETDVYRNLAIEEWLLDHSANEPMVLFYRNRDAVVIGRHQNPWLETDTHRLRSEQVALARRSTGGGAVYHDLGNLNYAFITSANDHNPPEHLSLIQATLQKFGIPNHLNKNKDIIVRQRKVGGTAATIRTQRALFHGTLLFHTKLQALGKYLQPSLLSAESQAVASKPAPVINLTSIDPELNPERFIDVFISTLSEKAVYPPAVADIHFDAQMTELYRKYRSPEWIYGRTPVFTAKLGRQYAGFENKIELHIRNGVVQNIFYGRSGDFSIGEILSKRWHNIPFDHPAMLAQLQPQSDQQTERDLYQWFTQIHF